MWTINNQYHSIYQFELIAIIVVFLPKFNAIAYDIKSEYALSLPTPVCCHIL